MNRIKRFVEVTTSLVNFVNKTDTRDAVFSSLAPNCFRLSLNTHLTIKDHNRAIEDTERTLNFSCEVDVTRGIDNVNLVALPIGSHGSGGNSNTTFLFLLHPVSSSTAGVTLN